MVVQPTEDAGRGRGQIRLDEACLRQPGNFLSQLLQERGSPDLDERATGVSEPAEASITTPPYRRTGLAGGNLSLTHRPASILRVSSFTYSAAASCHDRSSPPGSGVASSTPQAGGFDGRGHVLSGTSLVAMSMPASRRISRAHSAREARPVLMMWCIPPRLRPPGRLHSTIRATIAPARSGA